MIERHGRTIAAFIMVALLMAVVILFATVDLQFDSNTMTDVGSAPILSGDDRSVTPASPLQGPEDQSTVTPPHVDQH